MKMLVKKLSFVAALVLFFLFTCQLLAGLKLSDWKTYTSLVEAADATIDDEGLLWVGTSGGVFTYNFISREIKEFRNTEGLLSLKVSAINYNNLDKSIYIGTTDGYLHILSKDKKWTYITDIVVANFPNPSIKKILFYGDYAIIAGGFGVAKFDIKKKVFVETVKRFDYLESNPKINDLLIFDNKIWVATESGIATISLNKQIVNPKDWKLYSKKEGLEFEDSRLLYEFEGILYTASENVISKFDGTFTQVQTSKEDKEIKSIFDFNGKLYYSNLYEIFDINNVHSGLKSYWKETKTIKKLKYNNNDLPVILYDQFAISFIQNSENIHVLPNTPLSNIFADLDIDSKGKLWVATRLKDQNNGRGFSNYDQNGKWTNYQIQIDNNVFDQCLKLKIGKKDEIYISTWGTGLMKMIELDSGFSVERYDTTNSPFTGAITNAGNYIITGETKIDSYGNVWTINYGEGNPGPILISKDENGNYTTYNNQTALTDRQFIDLEIDQWGTKWLASTKFGKGIYYFNENGTPENLLDDKYGKITQSNTDNSLLDNDQTALALDKTGILWIGTAAGLNFIPDTYSALSDDKINVRKVDPLNNQFITDIHIDALNNKWIATNKGVWVLSEDAFETLNTEILNTSNSPLIDNYVVSITSNPETGLIYFGTKSGLSVAHSNSILAKNKYDIKCYPQPYNPISNEELFIDGLEENSNVTITANDGTFVKSINVKGRIASWDGRDFNGNIVSNGIYIVVGSSATTKGGAVGKFAVMKK